MAGIESFTHVQSVASSTWTINHNLGHKPSIEVVVDVGGQRQVILPSRITNQTDDILVVSFTSPYTGSARLY